MTSNEKRSDEVKPEETSKDADLGRAEVQALSDEAAEKGFYGEVPDETPNSAYTLKGVTSGEKTPETDPDRLK